MQKLWWFFVGILLAAASIVCPAARADANVTTLNFAVTRNGEPIGNSTVRLQRRGEQIVAEVATNVQVKFASFTVYRYEERHVEHWIGNSLAALSGVTDDNGSVHKVSVTRNGDKLSVNANGRVTQVDAGVVPASLWNPVVVRIDRALDTKDGSVIPISVVDHGKEQLVLQGRPTTAHHYSIRTTFPQDIWYDDQQRLVRVELRGIDGSTIRYQLG
jgi:hypothetical protein